MKRDIEDKLVICRNGNEFWHINKASEYLGITTQALKIRVKKGLMPAFRISGLLSGNPYYFLVSDVKSSGKKYIRKYRFF